MSIKVVIAWIIAIGLLVFMAQNYETVQISLLLWTVELPRAVMILLVFAAGILVGWLVSTVRRMEKSDDDR
ncbi:MAG: LapA family protein [Gammaproteobacteria bacterium]|nr:LapA family protein [Gammaproteobacteria bacterium]